ncbi:hypothetical protein LINPERHAP2_LOCUS18568, partial [Linum perenne]
ISNLCFCFCFSNRIGSPSTINRVSTLKVFHTHSTVLLCIAESLRLCSSRLLFLAESGI